MVSAASLTSVNDLLHHSSNNVKNLCPRAIAVEFALHVKRWTSARRRGEKGELQTVWVREVRFLALENVTSDVSGRESGEREIVAAIECDEMRAVRRLRLRQKPDIVLPELVSFSSQP